MPSPAARPRRRAAAGASPTRTQAAQAAPHAIRQEPRKARTPNSGLSPAARQHRRTQAGNGGPVSAPRRADHDPHHAAAEQPPPAEAPGARTRRLPLARTGQSLALPQAQGRPAAVTSRSGRARAADSEVTDSESGAGGRRPAAAARGRGSRLGAAA